MRSSTSSIFFTALLVAVLVLIQTSQVTSQEARPIFMDRREASPFGDILSELKGKGLGGRMRFGKRSGYEPQLQVNDPNHSIYDKLFFTAY